MLIQPNGTNLFTQSFITKLAQDILSLDRVAEGFPFEYSHTPTQELDFSANKIAGFTQVKNIFNLENEIFINPNDAKDLGQFVIKLIKNYRQ